MTKKVFEVTTVTLVILKKNPPVLEINAYGKVSSGGWKKGKLIPYVYIAPPADGLYEFDFVAGEPNGASIQVISEITSEPFLWDDFPKDLKGVKVYSSSNFEITKL